MSDCIFCSIVAGKIPSQKIYEDDKIIVIKDVNPAAPEHVLFLPKEHFASILDVKNEISAHIMDKIPEIARKLSLDKDGFRVVINTGKDGGQTVEHLHFHLLGGRFLEWPPG